MSRIKIHDMDKGSVPSAKELERIMGGIKDGTSNTFMIGEYSRNVSSGDIVLTGKYISIK